MPILTPFQTTFIKHLGHTVLRESFFLTGGTALAAFYLRHRLSEDLDFFTDDEGAVAPALPIIQSIAENLNARLEIHKSFRTFLGFTLYRKKQTVRCDFAFDSPFRLAEKIYNKRYGIFVDNKTDIACNKLSALFDRNEAKDFVDIYFICREILPFEELLELAKQKHIGMENYWLAVSLSKINQIKTLPRMIKPVSLRQMKLFFKNKAEWLMRDG